VLSHHAEFHHYPELRFSAGQLIHNPVKTAPASEIWLYENPEALASVKQGLRESAEGKSIDRGSLSKFAKE